MTQAVTRQTEKATKQAQHGTVIAIGSGMTHRNLKRPPKYQITLGVCTWQGGKKRTVEALRDVHLGRLLSEPENAWPTVELVEGLLVVVFMDHYARWQFGLAVPKIGFGPREFLCADNSATSRQEALFAARRAVAQHVFTTDNDGMAAVHPDDEAGRTQHAEWVRYHRAHKRPTGYTHEEACEVARSLLELGRGRRGRLV